MSKFLNALRTEKIQNFFLFILFISMPFSVAGDDLAVIGLYLVMGYLLFKKKVSIPKHFFLYGVGILVLAAIISSLFSDAPATSFGYFRKFWRFGLPLIIVIILKKQPPQKYLNVLIVISIIVGLYAIIQAFTGLDVLRSAKLQGEYHKFGSMWQSVGVFSHHLTFGGVYLLLFSLFTPPVFNKNFSGKERCLYTAGSAITLLALVLTLGRSTWLGAVLSIAIILCFSLNKKIVVGGLVIFAIAATAFFMNLKELQNTSEQTSPILRRLASAFSVQQNRDRIFMWQAGIETIADNPVLGIGARMGKKMQPYYDKVARQQNHRFQHKATTGVHNIYLQTWINFGIFGLFGYLIWWLSIIIHIIFRLAKTSVYTSRENGWLLGLLAGFTGSMAAGFFENNFRDAEVQVVILTFMGLAVFLLQNGQKNSLSNGDDKHKNN